jgi:hypothetical protein
MISRNWREGKRHKQPAMVDQRSRRQWSRRGSSDMHEARKGERAGGSELIEAQAISAKPAELRLRLSDLFQRATDLGLQTRVATTASVSLFAQMNY